MDCCNCCLIVNNETGKYSKYFAIKMYHIKSRNLLQSFFCGLSVPCEQLLTISAISVDHKRVFSSNVFSPKVTMMNATSLKLLHVHSVSFEETPITAHYLLCNSSCPECSHKSLDSLIRTWLVLYITCFLIVLSYIFKIASRHVVLP